VNALAQADHFLNTTSRWYVTRQFPNGQPQDPGFIAIRTDVFFYSGDSTIAGTTWNKLYTSTNENLSSPVFKGYIHSSAPYVFFRDIAGNTDILYNFSLQVGDSILYNFGQFNAWIKVQTTDSVQVNGNWHKRIRFAEPEGPNAFTELGEEWIEGIGSKYSPLFPLTPRLFSTEVTDTEDLSCTFYSASAYWHNSGFTECFSQRYFSLHEAMPEPLLRIYPNPVTDVLYAVMEQNGTQPADVRIYDHTGRTVYQASPQGTSFQLQLGTLAPGMYHIGINAGGRTFYRSFIKK
ncbi:MAG: T9SS type A sorting domain-containing protein, partial [Bacteroidia bacterium]|nr:T9SS type A sorting domain-containing protein [Bacteroidia bacterium]